jgi:hypothetical protein
MKTKFYVGISGILLPEFPGVKIYTFTDAPQWGSLNGENIHSWDAVTDQHVSKHINNLCKQS